jgi:site-specific DNA-methyltransferase (adenine-specific)
MALELNKIYAEDCLITMSRMSDETVDLTVTSPPYDNLRSYNGYSFDFQSVANELFRITKQGGVVVWIVGDATVKGSETGTSFQQALYFKKIGFNLHDTMIWEKTGRLPTQDRYYAVFEYMFVFSKGKPKSMNFICDHKTVNGGKIQRRDSTINKGGNKKSSGTFTRKEYSRRPNIWKIHVGKNLTSHPAIFPEQLAQDHIISWSDKEDLVYDPFLGSGTTAKMAFLNNRNFIGSEISNDYVSIARERLLKEGIFV